MIAVKRQTGQKYAKYSLRYG